jgi:hut operon positive regulator
MVKQPLGRTALLLALGDEDDLQQRLAAAHAQGFKACTGKVGSMDLPKIIAAVETAARREGLIDSSYRAQHSIYHATIDALQGLTRGPIELGSMLRTVGLRFTVVIGPRTADDPDGPWLAVAMYGMIGAPIRGHEHEVCGLGINHL